MKKGKMKKRLVTLVLLLGLCLSQIFVFGDTTSEAATGKWKKDSKGYYYEYSKGKYAKNEWVKSSGKWYFINDKGYMVTGWKKIGGKWYYFNGAGIMQTGWRQIGGKWYYFNTNGTMAVGWKKIGSKWYFFADGVMVTGWRKISGYWYYFKAGVMATGWTSVGAHTYLMLNDGTLFTDKIYVDDEYVYLFKTNNELQSYSTYKSDLVFVFEELYYNKSGDLVVKGYYVNTSKTKYITSYSSVDMTIYDADKEVVTAVNYTNSEKVYLPANHHKSSLTTIVIPPKFLEKKNADLSDFSCDYQFYGVY